MSTYVKEILEQRLKALRDEIPRLLASERGAKLALKAVRADLAKYRGSIAELEGALASLRL